MTELEIALQSGGQVLKGATIEPVSIEGRVGIEGLPENVQSQFREATAKNQPLTLSASGQQESDLQRALRMGGKIDDKPQEIYEKYVKPIAYPVAEALGMAGGGVVGSAGGPVGTVAGAGLGYGAVKELEGIIENFMGVSKPKTLPKELAEAGKNVAMGATLEMGGQAIGKGVGYIAEKAAKKMYQSALKPSPSLPISKIDKRIMTGMEENIPVSRGGYEKAKKIITTMNQEVDKRISRLGQQAVTIDRDAALEPVAREIPKIFKKNISPLKPANTINDYIIEIQQIQPERIGIKEAQEFKKFINKELDQYFKSVGGKIAPATAETSAQSAMASGLRQEIAKALPEISKLNAREGSVIELNKSMANAVNRINNRELIPLLVGFGIGGSSSASTGLWKALLFKIIDQPYVKSKAAIVLHRAYTKQLAEPTAKTLGILMNQDNIIELDAEGNEIADND